MNTRLVRGCRTAQELFRKEYLKFNSCLKQKISWTTKPMGESEFRLLIEQYFFFSKRIIAQTKDRLGKQCNVTVPSLYIEKSITI